MPWPVLPACPSFGFTSRADYSVTIIERASGVRSVNRNWYYPLQTFTAVPIGDKPQEDIHKILRFWHAVGGQAGRFLFKDYTDFKSSRRINDATTAIDQPIVMDSNGDWQLTKVYEDEEFLFQQQRKISKPKLGTVSIAIDGVTATPTVDYTIDYDTGLVTFVALDSPPGVLTWGGEFYVPVMFETVPEFMVSNKDVQQTGFALREIRL
jgi:uncharacterized protein (TIGR02217 family)